MEETPQSNEVINLTTFRGQYSVSPPLNGGDGRRYAVEENGGYDVNGVAARSAAVWSGDDTLESP